MTEQEEKIYINGRLSAWRSMLTSVLFELRNGGFEVDNARAIVDFAALRAVFRNITMGTEYDDWNDGLHLPDVFEKHVVPAIEAQELTERLASKIDMCERQWKAVGDQFAREHVETPFKDGYLAGLLYALKAMRGLDAESEWEPK